MRTAMLLICVLLLAGCTMSGMQTADVVNAAYEDRKEISAYFCPHENCSKALSSFILSAKESVHCAFFELNLPEAVEALEKQSKKGVDVKVVVDGDNYDEVREIGFLRAENDSNYMHNKFCVVDGKRISSGSMNPTKNCAFKNNNNLILINSINLARNYEEEFEEIWNGVYGKGGEVDIPIVYLNGSKVENYFCPEDKCGEKIMDALKKAEESIHFMTFSFTHDGIANVLLMKNLENVSITGVFEKTGSEGEYSKFKVLQYQGADVRQDKNPAVMHHKVFVIDNKTVVTGSFNPSANADKYNDENVLIINDKEIAERYLEEFEFVWRNASAG